MDYDFTNAPPVNAFGDETYEQLIDAFRFFDNAFYSYQQSKKTPSFLKGNLIQEPDSLTPLSINERFQYRLIGVFAIILNTILMDAKMNNDLHTPGMKYHSINLSHLVLSNKTDFGYIKFKSHGVDLYPDGSIEIRSIRAMHFEQWIGVLRLFEARIELLRSLKQPIEYNPFPLNAAWKDRVAHFKQYVEESGLRWSNYRGLIPKKDPQITEGIYIDAQEHTLPSGIVGIKGPSYTEVPVTFFCSQTFSEEIY
jgi:hypothetical protein